MSASPLRQFALQAASTLLVLSLAWPYYGLQATELPWFETALVIGGVAVFLASITRQPLWWRIMHGAFMPLAWAVTQLDIDPGWFLLAFILMLLIYRGAVTEQIPLYLTNAATANALGQLVADRPEQRFLDLGAGIGSTLLPLARRYSRGRFVGIENAPLTWFLGWLRSRGRENIEWRWGDLWQVDLKDFDLVYAFLSPAPMAELWEKVRSEMKPGSLFVSNSFPVPDVAAHRVIEVECDPPRSLYCYQL